MSRHRPDPIRNAAPVLASILALALVPALPAGAAPPENSCFVLAGRPIVRGAGGSAVNAVERLVLRVNPLTGNDRASGAPWRYVRLEVVMAPRAQGLADGVHGKRLTQSLVCRTDTGLCEASDGDALMALRPAPDGGLTLITRDMPVADYGGSDLASNLAHPPGTATRVELRRAPLENCRDL